MCSQDVSARTRRVLIALSFAIRILLITSSSSSGSGINSNSINLLGNGDDSVLNWTRYVNDSGDYTRFVVSLRLPRAFLDNAWIGVALLSESATRAPYVSAFPKAYERGLNSIADMMGKMKLYTLLQHEI